MRERQPRKQTSAAQGLTGELMLAKSVIEEKNELLDRKDRTIRELVTKMRSLEVENDELRQAFEHASRHEEMARVEERSSVLNAVISDVVRIAADYEDIHGTSSTGLASRIYSLFQEKYELRIIATPPQSVDPQLHHVVEVDHDAGTEDGSIEILSNGYRVGETVIRPALVKVVLGIRQEDNQEDDREDGGMQKERRFKIAHGDYNG